MGEGDGGDALVHLALTSGPPKVENQLPGSGSNIS